MKITIPTSILQDTEAEAFGFLRSLRKVDPTDLDTSNEVSNSALSAAIIHYDPPGLDLLPEVWRVMLENFDASLDEPLISELVSLFPQITPRDVKMLLRLTLRVARSRSEPLNADLFRRNAMFRGINAKDCEK